LSTPGGRSAGQQPQLLGRWSAEEPNQKTGVAMRLDLVKKPEGEWVSFNELCGTGDGKTAEFLSPIPASEARQILVTRNFEMMDPEGRLIVKNEKTGSIERDDADGYKLETRGEELWVVFDRPIAFGVRVSVSGLGRQIGDSFKIAPMSTVLQKAIQEKQPLAIRKREKDVSLLDLQEAGRVSFMALVEDWSGIEGEDGALECTPINKKIFLDQKDAMFFGLFVSNRSGAIRTERINSFAKDSSD
jgi:hypothetical protein